LTVGARLERGAKGRLGLSTVLVANLDRLVSICDTSVPGALQVTRNHLGQVADNLGQVGSIIDFVLNVRKRSSVCRLQIADDFVGGLHLTTDNTVTESVVVLIVFIAPHDQHLEKRHLLAIPCIHVLQCLSDGSRCNERVRGAL